MKDVLTHKHQQKLITLKMTFPNRVVFGVFIDGKFYTFAEHTHRKMNKFIKSGYIVWELKS